MPQKKEQEQPAKKFLFDLRSFDEPEPEPEEVVPPPPSFSEEELAAARTEEHTRGYAEGKLEGNRLAVQSREQLTANTLRAISESFTMLFAAEYDREKTYEYEAVRLTLETIRKLFPVLNERFGQKEIHDVILKVLRTRGRQSVITIEVSPDDAHSVEELLAGHWSDPESAPRYRVLAQKDLNPGQCRLAWEDGGAVRDAADLAAKITDSLAALLDKAGSNAAQNVPAGQNDAINEQDTGESAQPTTPTGDTP